MIYSFQRTLVSTRLSALTNSTTYHPFSSQLLPNILPSFFYLSNEGFLLLKTKKILLSLHLSQSLFDYQHGYMPSFCFLLHSISSVQFSCSVMSCDPMNRRTPGLPVHHQLPEFTQTHVHWVGDAIQPSDPLSSPSPPALNLSHEEAKVFWGIIYLS